MIYGQFQYYSDELNSWSRTIEFLKEELRRSVRQIALLMSQQVISADCEKTGNTFTDRFIVQEQQFEHIIFQIISQQQRLERTALYPCNPIDASVSHSQDALRSKMKFAERNFLQTKYTCSAYLSSFLGHGSFALQHH
jgi:hypothetical protein